MRKRPIAIGENVGWLHFLSRDVHKCSGQFLHSNKEGTLSIAPLEVEEVEQVAGVEEDEDVVKVAEVVEVADVVDIVEVV